jgi:NurA-like 5'-3' nuclease
MNDRLPYCDCHEGIKGYTESSIAKGETKDCVVRAFASSFEVNYDFAHRYVADVFKRTPREGTSMTSPTLVKMSDNNTEVNGKKVYTVGNRTNNWMSNSLVYEVKVKGQKVKRNMTVGTFIKNNPTGTFFILVRGHAFTIKNGVVIGNTEDAIKKRKVVECVFEIK